MSSFAVMPAFTLIQYFFYLAINWNLPIAIHIIWNEFRGEKKYGINTTGSDQLHSLKKKGIDTSHATIYMPAGYDMLETIFTEIKKFNLNHFLDVGCGKGRAMCVAAHYNFVKLTGIDFSGSLCESASINLQKTQAIFPAIRYTVVNNDAFYYHLPSDADCIFMFNPFDEMIMSGVIENIEISLEKYPRNLCVIYLNPVYKNLFLDRGFKQVYHLQKLKYLEACILQKEMTSP
ncbi:MAG: class I SAM-dependent methyltransferase [Ferruginibacter sp.]